MKKALLFCAAAAIAFGMASCSDDNDSITPNPDQPRFSRGAYILNQGNYSTHVPGGLYALDYYNEKIAANVFQNANGGISLGDTPQCGIAYGSKIYIGVFESNCIWVLNKSDYTQITRLSLKGHNNGDQPRSMVATGGKVYISMYSGHVCRMDTTTLTLDASVKVGPNPEIIGLYNNKLYVPNSDGMSYPYYGKTASVIDLNTFTVTATFTVPENPYQFVANQTGLYLLSKGNYTDVASKLYKVDGTDCVEIAPATIIASGDDEIYFINDPFYGATPAEYKVYDCNQNKVYDWQVNKVTYPSNIAVDEIGNRIFISSLVMDGQYPSWVAPGYINEYDGNSRFVKRYDIGAGPTAIFFDQY